MASLQFSGLEVILLAGEADKLKESALVEEVDTMQNEASVHLTK